MEFYLDEFSEDYFEEGGEYYDPSMDMLKLDIDKLFCALEYVEDSYDIAIREADLKCYTESGDDEDLMSYYEDADAKLVEKSQNILQKLWKKLLELFEKIKSKFRKKVEVVPDATVYVPKPFHNLMKKFKSAWGAAKSAIIAGKDGLMNHKAVAGFLALLTTAMLTIGGIVVYKNRDKIKGSLSRRKDGSGDVPNAAGKELDLTAPSDPGNGKMVKVNGKDINALTNEMNAANDSLGAMIKKWFKDAKENKSSTTDSQRASVVQEISNQFSKCVDKVTSIGLKSKKEAKAATA